MQPWRFFMRRESLRRRNNAKNAIRNNAESAINMRAIKNNAENAIKPQRTIMRQRQQAPASVFCKDQAARQSRERMLWRTLRLLTGPEGA